MENFNRWFALALKAEAKARKLSYRKLAAFLGRSLSTFTQWIYADREPAHPDLIDVAQRLGWEPLNMLPPAIRSEVEKELGLATPLSIEDSAPEVAPDPKGQPSPRPQGESEADNGFHALIIAQHSLNPKWK